MPGVVPVLSHSELSLRLRQQKLVAAFGRLALRAEGLEEVLGRASVAAAEGLEAEFAKILEYRSGTMDFVVRSGVGWKPGVVGNAVLQGDSQSPAGHAFETGKPVISNHLASEQRFKTPDLLTEHGVESAINVLVGARGGMTYGVLEVDIPGAASSTITMSRLSRRWPTRWARRWRAIGARLRAKPYSATTWRWFGRRNS